MCARYSVLTSYRREPYAQDYDPGRYGLKYSLVCTYPPPIISISEWVRRREGIRDKGEKLAKSLKNGEKMEKLSFNKDKYQQPQKATTHYWQDRALKVMEELGIDKRWTGSIMRHFKRKPEKAEAVYRNMAGKTFKDAARYFHKLMAL